MLTGSALLPAVPDKVSSISRKGVKSLNDCEVIPSCFAGNVTCPQGGSMKPTPYSVVGEGS